MTPSAAGLIVVFALADSAPAAAAGCDWTGRGEGPDWTVSPWSPVLVPLADPEDRARGQRGSGGCTSSGVAGGRAPAGRSGV